MQSSNFGGLWPYHWMFDIQLRPVIRYLAYHLGRILGQFDILSITKSKIANIQTSNIVKYHILSNLAWINQWRGSFLSSRSLLYYLLRNPIIDNNNYQAIQASGIGFYQWLLLSKIVVSASISGFYYQN